MINDPDKTDAFADPTLVREGEEEETADLPIAETTQPSLKGAMPTADPTPEVKAHLSDALLQKARAIREQRDTIRGRIEKIEASKGQVKENVYRKVAADYLQRLEESRKKLLAIKGEIDQELAVLYEKEQEAAQRAHLHAENLEEARFRNELGEYTREEFKKLIANEEAQLNIVTQEQNALQGAISQYEEIFAGEDLMEPVPPQAKPLREVPAAPQSASPIPTPSVGTVEPRVASREGEMLRRGVEERAQPAPPPPGIVILRENGEVAGEYPIESQMYIGRSPTNEIVLKEAKVSRKHAGILRKDNGYLLVDNKSSNGTFVNGKRIAEHMLRSGDMIQIGSYELEFKTM